VDIATETFDNDINDINDNVINGDNYNMDYNYNMNVNNRLDNVKIQVSDALYSNWMRGSNNRELNRGYYRFDHVL
jgi:hypothetical protein